MSLINFKNFVEPLIDKRNLVTIVLIAALFGMVRLSGGRAGPLERPRDSVRPPPQSSVNRNSAAPSAGAVRVPAPRNEKGRTVLDEIRESDPMADQGEVVVRGGKNSRTRDPLIDSARKAPIPPPQAKKAAGNRGNEGLDEIEKQLGLR